MNDLWATPRDIFRALDREFGFALDVCASHDNHKTSPYITESDDGLGVDWRDWIAAKTPHGHHPGWPLWAWCNPPYSNPMPWVKKAALECAAGVGCVMLVPDDGSVGWFAEALRTVSEIRQLTASPKASGRGYHSGRIAFLGSDGKPAKGNNKGSQLLIWRPGIVGNGNPAVRFEPLASLQQRGQAWLESVRNESTKFDQEAA